MPERPRDPESDDGDVSRAVPGRARGIAVGVALLVSSGALLALSRRFPYDADPFKRPVILMVGVEIVAGIAYLLFLMHLNRTRGRGTSLAWVLVVGALMRAALFPSTVILEDDHYRYLWDGALVSHNVNPYTYAPLAATEGNGNVPPVLRKLADRAPDVFEHINHPHLRTIYPPVAQGAFALAYLIRPFDVLGLRVVFLAFDLIVLILLICLLDALGKDRIWLVVYWWNPLVAAQTYCHSHMDVIPTALVLGALLLSVRKRHLSGTAALALAAGAKLWPAALLPLFLRHLTRERRRMILHAGLFALVLAVVCVPIFLAGIDRSSGFYAYGQRWSNNDSFHRVVRWAAEEGMPRMGLPAWPAAWVARVTVALIFIGCVIAWSRRSITDGADLCRRALAIVAAMFLLSPTQFPWYYVWMVPLLAIHPRASLLLMTALLPLYYLRAWFDARGLFFRYENVLIAIEFVPVWGLLLREWIVARRTAAPLSELVDQNA